MNYSRWDYNNLQVLENLCHNRILLIISVKIPVHMINFDTSYCYPGINYLFYINKHDICTPTLSNVCPLCQIPCINPLNVHFERFSIDFFNFFRRIGHQQGQIQESCRRNGLHLCGIGWILNVILNVIFNKNRQFILRHAKITSRWMKAHHVFRSSSWEKNRKIRKKM